MIIEKEAANENKRDRNIRQALEWLRANNHLYKTSYSNYETLLKYDQPEPGAPHAVKVYEGVSFKPAKKSELRIQLLEDEQAGMLIPESYLSGADINLRDVATAIHHPMNRDEAAEDHVRFMCIRYGDRYVEEKIRPLLFRHGTGGWFTQRSHENGRADYTKWRLEMLFEGFRRDPNYIFYMLDTSFKERITLYNRANINVKQQVRQLTRDDLEDDQEYLTSCCE